MTVRLSPHSVRKILWQYFGGVPQAKIAKRAGVDQSTVSVYASRFKDRAAKIGLLAAGKEFQVFNEVDELRSLSVELAKSGLTVAEAKDGLKAFKAFMKLGVSPKQHTVLIKVLKDLEDPGFINAAVKLKQLEEENDMNYEEVISKFEKVTKQLSLIERQLERMQADHESVSKSLLQRKEELVSLEKQLTQSKIKTQDKVTEFKQQLALKMEELDVQDKEVEQVSTLKTELAKQGLDIPTLIKLAKEFEYGKAKD